MDKFKTCKDCPDRTVDPNCHDSCEGYKYRQDKKAKINEAKRKENDFSAFKKNTVYNSITAASNIKRRW